MYNEDFFWNKVYIIEFACWQLGVCEETEYQLRQQLKDTQEQNEELEFRLFELQECFEKVRSAGKL